MLTAEKHLKQIIGELKTTNRLLALLVSRLSDESGVVCPDCGSDDLNDSASTMGHPRLTCGGCNRSWEVDVG